MRKTINFPAPLEARLEYQRQTTGHSVGEVVRGLVAEHLPEPPPASEPVPPPMPEPPPAVRAKPKPSDRRLQVIAAVAGLYNEHCAAAGMPAVRIGKDGMPAKSITAKISTRVTAVGLAYDWEGYFARAAACPFLVGSNGRGWRASLVWLLNPNNMAKVEAGNYDATSDSGRHSFDNAAGAAEDFGAF